MLVSMEVISMKAIKQSTIASQSPQTGHVGFYMISCKQAQIETEESQSPQTGHVGFYGDSDNPVYNAFLDAESLNPLKRVMLVSI